MTPGRACLRPPTVVPGSRTPIQMTPGRTCFRPLTVVPVSRLVGGMKSDWRNGAGAHLVSGHPPKVPGSRLPLK